MNTCTDLSIVNKQRRAGILLHPTSLPGPLPSGDIGHEAYRFIEFLHANGFKVWQMLPLGPTHEDRSPYQCLSSHAGNPLLISLDWLEDKGWLNRKELNENENHGCYRGHCLQQASRNFYHSGDSVWIEKLNNFTKENTGWLEDFALYMALKTKYNNKPWYEWPQAIRHREPIIFAEERSALEAKIKQIFFEQFIFFSQWHEMHAYAKRHGIELFGDMPIFVAHDSADVWAQRENFLINIDGDMEYISGVPPDAFSETGQRWGNPLYDWDYMQSTDYGWWKERFVTQLKLFDLVRIDHFRGLQACWQIPKSDSTAMSGEWVKVPGREMLAAVNNKFHHLPIVAEDLGVITDDVIELKNEFQLPGMKVLQFGFDGNNNNPHLPHRHERDDLVYTGTHDNDTSLGWFLNASNYDKKYLQKYTGLDLTTAQQGLLAIIRLAMSSVSFLCILPMQDLLMLDSTARMNIPGTIANNWIWRFDWQQVDSGAVEEISRLMMLYQR